MTTQAVAEVVTNKADILYVASLALSLVLFRAVFGALLSAAYADDRYTYVLLVPCLSALLLIRATSGIRPVSRLCPRGGLPVLTAGLLLYRNAGEALSIGNFTLTRAMFAVVLFWAGTVLALYGPEAFRVSAAAWCFLLFVVPLPSGMLDSLAVVLQGQSANAAAALFRLTGMPAVRQGVLFSLPGVDIEIAKECSGIRSSLALVLMNGVAAQMMLQSYAKKAALIVLSIPFVVCKNAIRIVTISWLGVYVNPAFFHGALHRNGGLVFSLLDTVALFVALTLLRRTETSGSPVART
ncbi:MAG: exosortase/archaeosortase family protein [Acidobacteriota bacterium]